MGTIKKAIADFDPKYFEGTVPADYKLEMVDEDHSKYFEYIIISSYLWGPPGKHKLLKVDDFEFTCEFVALGITGGQLHKICFACEAAIIKAFPEYSSMNTWFKQEAAEKALRISKT